MKKLLATTIAGVALLVGGATAASAEPRLTRNSGMHVRLRIASPSCSIPVAFDASGSPTATFYYQCGLDGFWIYWSSHTQIGPGPVPQSRLGAVAGPGTTRRPVSLRRVLRAV